MILFIKSLIADSKVLSDVRRIVCDGEYVPDNPKELCGRLFVTCYMGTENSSQETKSRAACLAEQIGRLVLIILIFNMLTAVTCVHQKFILHLCI